MFKKVFLIAASLSVLSACTITQEIEPAELEQDVNVCIIENPKVREGFLEELTSVLTAKGISHTVVNESSIPEECKWTATYTARWSWDMSLYMAYAEIKVFHNGNLDGKAIYDSTGGSGNMNKFIRADEKIKELVNELIQMKSASAFGRYLG